MADSHEKTHPRPPVVAILGHIDHGKSTLLDYIQKSNVVEGEAGGITQHVRAYEVTHKDEDGADKKISFIDTPGHAAFARSRKTGAQIADIALLIVSAEEGVKEQTIECLKVLEENKTPFIVVANKIDRPNANIEKIKQQLAEHMVLVEGYGGNVPLVSVSAKEGTGINDLLDMILLVADLEEFVGEKEIGATGFVLESHIDPKIGITGTFVIKNGSLSIGNFIVISGVVSKIKRLDDFSGKQVPSATMSAPIRIAGLAEIPKPESPFTVFADKKEADDFASLEHKTKEDEESALVAEEEGQVLIPLVVKADTIGTLNATLEEIESIPLPKENMNVKVLFKGVGDIAEGDLKHALAAKNTLVLGFNVKVDKVAQDFAENAQLPLHTFDIIYKVKDFVAEELKKRTPLERVEEAVAKAKVIRLFSQEKKKQMIGAEVTEGTATDKLPISIVRGKEAIGKAKTSGMQVQKEKVHKAEQKTQFGAMLESETSIELGDELHYITIVEK